MTTLARPQSDTSSHWYFPDGTPCHTVKCTTKDGERPTTIADAKKLKLVPSPTTILRVLHKEALVQWRCEQVALACLTSPKRNDEPLDDFVKRILHVDKEHEQEGKSAAERGTQIHRALKEELSGFRCEYEMLPWIEPVWHYLNDLGACEVHCEETLLGKGYAGTTDLWLGFAQISREDILVDFKTKDVLPKKAYTEDRLQLAAYAACIPRAVRTMNIYISRKEPGKFTVIEHDDWQRDFEAFKHLLSYWQIANDFYP